MRCRHGALPALAPGGAPPESQLGTARHARDGLARQPSVRSKAHRHGLQERLLLLSKRQLNPAALRVQAAVLVHIGIIHALCTKRLRLVSGGGRRGRPAGAWAQSGCSSPSGVGCARAASRWCLRTAAMRTRLEPCCNGRAGAAAWRQAACMLAHCIEGKRWSGAPGNENFAAVPAGEFCHWGRHHAH